VVFENLDYGNALYVMFGRWAELSKRTRLDLLQGGEDGYERILHRRGWQHRLVALVTGRRRGQAA
jgi:hypothetical protein